MRKGIAKVLAILVLVLALGELIPRFVLSNNLEKFSGEQRVFAEQAWTEARLLLSGSAEPLFWTVIRVEKVVEKEDLEGKTCYEATVRAYTLFTLPWSSVLVSSCNKGSIIRQHWGLAPFLIGWPAR